ncbi:MAG: preprotein translocase subunit SecE [Candidatus Saccharimonadales bacterium]
MVAAKKKSTVPQAKKRLSLPTLRRSKKSDESVGYFAGAWRELRQVRWPDRHATWALTLAVMLFSLFFAVIILGLDYGFNELFRKVIL